MSPVLELVFEASSQHQNPLITEGPNTDHNPLNYNYRNSPEYMGEEIKNEEPPLLLRAPTLSSIH